MESPYYTDHLISALRCLDDENLRKLASEIKKRVKPIQSNLTMEEKLEYVKRLRNEKNHD